MRRPARTASFLERVLRSDGDEEIDIPSLVRELPASRAAPKTDAADRKLAMKFLTRYQAETDSEAKRTWGMTFLCLLPFADTGLAVELLRDPDLWTPEAAVSLLELRRYTKAIPELEWLAHEGKTNGDGAAMRALVHLGTPKAAAALERLEKVLKGKKRSLLQTYRGGPARPTRR